METAREKIKMIMDRLGMSGSIAAKAMNMPDSTFRKKIMPSISNKPFTEKNHSDLVEYLIKEIEFLVTHKKANNKNVIPYEYVLDHYKDIYKNYKKYRKKEDWSLLDELTKVVDFMETSDVFSDIKLYTQIIDDIVFESTLIDNESIRFTVEKYNDYALSDKKMNHSKWFDYIIYRRQQIIKDILKD